MKKILVTTDFSTGSKAGLRFAIQLASQSKLALNFFLSYNIMSPTVWTEVKIKDYDHPTVPLLATSSKISPPGYETTLCQ